MKKEDDILKKYELQKAIRITASIARFLHNCQAKDADKTMDLPLITEETKKQIMLWIHRVQGRYQENDKFQHDKLHLNLQRNSQGIFECRGRIQGDYPV